MRTLVAAAVQKGDKVRMPFGGSYVDFVICEVLNATPKPGQIMWLAVGGQEFVLPADMRVEVVQLA